VSESIRCRRVRACLSPISDKLAAVGDDPFGAGVCLAAIQDTVPSARGGAATAGLGLAAVERSTVSEKVAAAFVRVGHVNERVALLAAGFGVVSTSLQGRVKIGKIVSGMRL
jgi:hypothetical protein